MEYSKMMQTTLLITQDNLKIAENCKNNLEMIKNHFLKHLATNKTPSSDKKEKETTTSELKRIKKVSESPLIKKKRKKNKNNKSNLKRTRKTVQTSITKSSSGCYNSCTMAILFENSAKNAVNSSKIETNDNNNVTSCRISSEGEG